MGTKNKLPMAPQPFHPHLTTPSPLLTASLACVSAPAAKSCSTTVACPFIEAINSGVYPSCGAGQGSVRHIRYQQK